MRNDKCGFGSVINAGSRTVPVMFRLICNWGKLWLRFHNACHIVAKQKYKVNREKQEKWVMALESNIHLEKYQLTQSNVVSLRSDDENVSTNKIRLTGSIINFFSITTEFVSS